MLGIEGTAIWHVGRNEPGRTVEARKIGVKQPLWRRPFSVVLLPMTNNTLVWPVYCFYTLSIGSSRLETITAAAVTLLS
jgi:hypothetical protein